MKDQAHKLRELAGKNKKATTEMPEGNCRVMAVTSGKGGVGKTNVVANLGCALAARGNKVLALDADFLINVPVLPPGRVAEVLGDLENWALLPHEHFYDPADYRRVWWRHSKMLATLSDLKSGQNDTWLFKRLLYHDKCINSSQAPKLFSISGNIFRTRTA